MSPECLKAHWDRAEIHVRGDYRETICASTFYQFLVLVTVAESETLVTLDWRIGSNERVYVLDLRLMGRVG